MQEALAYIEEKSKIKSMLKKYPDRIAVLLSCNFKNLKSKKFLVHSENTLLYFFHNHIKKELGKSEGIYLVANGIMPSMSDTFGKIDCKTNGDRIIYIVIHKEATFG